MSLNRVILSGNLTADPEIRATGSGLQVAKFTIAVNEFRKQEKYTSFFDCTAFGKTAEFMQNYLKKGNKVLLEGRLEQQRWESKEGEKRNKVAILVEKLESAGSGTTASGGNPSGSGYSKPSQTQNSNRQSHDDYSDNFDGDIDYMGDQSDLPF